MRDRWKHRRRMAYMSMMAGLMYPLLLLFYTESPQLGAVAMPFYMFVGAVVGAYVGFATFDDKWRSENGQQVQSAETLRDAGDLS